MHLTKSKKKKNTATLISSFFLSFNRTVKERCIANSDACCMKFLTNNLALRKEKPSYNFKVGSFSGTHSKEECNLEEPLSL